jgi:hypothetical protein
MAFAINVVALFAAAPVVTHEYEQLMQKMPAAELSEGNHQGARQ